MDLHSPITIITLDGPAGVGKSTLAGLLAGHLKVAYLDTGAMFRTLALKLGEGAEQRDPEELRTLCKQWEFTLTGHGVSSTLLCNNSAIRSEIRSEEVGILASRLATVGVVREILKEAQRNIGEKTSLVAEGRDMGSVVFPTARFKFFLDACPEVRAMRRMRQLEEQGQSVDLNALTAQIRERDAQDRNRVIAPLRPAADAVIIDTSKLDEHAVLGELLKHIYAGTTLLA